MKAPAVPPHAAQRVRISAAASAQSGAVQTRDISTAYRICGAGPWLVLSHSLACDHTMWEPQIETLARSFRVLAYDTRGHGRTSAPPGPYSLEMLAADLKALLDALAIDRCHFVGLSMGGMIGQTFALAYPGVLRSMVLCDTSSGFPPGTDAAWEARVRQAAEGGMSSVVAPTLERWFTPETHRSRPDVLAAFARQIEATPTEGYTACSRALVKVDTTTRLNELDLPVLMLVGARDIGTPVSMARVIHEGIRGSELAVIDGAAHFPNIERTAAFDEVLLDFLGRHAAPLSTETP
jgi:3-oxoadipate enol-lactonase